MLDTERRLRGSGCRLRTVTRAGTAALATCIGATMLGGAAARAAESDHVSIDGTRFGLWWALPFAGLLLSIAIVPLAAPGLWHRHFGKLSVAWALAVAVPLMLALGIDVALHALLAVLIADYVPFIILLFALFTVAGGLRLHGRLHGTPAENTALLATGTLVASWIGTTGAAILLIRPLLRGNEWRRNRVHVPVFLIFLVANIGGALTPLGDPPLFLGFLRGIDFFWPTIRLLLPMLTMAVPLLVVFYVLDSILFRREGTAPQQVAEPLRLDGTINIALLGLIVVAVLLSGIWASGVAIPLGEIAIALEDLVRDGLLVAIAIASLRLTNQETRRSNGFTWAPILEVAKLFLGIFVTMVPVLAMLRAGPAGAFAGAIALVSDPQGEPIPAAYFWMTGALSSFLDNAPAYLVFFDAAGGNAAQLMSVQANTLVAISAGAVFMGANSYIGNAPNFMVRAIAAERGVKMPSFFAYMGWAALFLGPLYVVVMVLFFL